MGRKNFDVFGWTASYATSAYSGAPISPEIGKPQQTKLVTQEASAAALKAIEDAKAKAVQEKLDAAAAKAVAEHNAAVAAAEKISADAATKKLNADLAAE